MAGVLTRRPWRAARTAADFELHLDPAVVKSDDTAWVRSLLESALACVVSIESVPCGTVGRLGELGFALGGFGMAIVR